MKDGFTGWLPAEAWSIKLLSSATQVWLMRAILNSCFTLSSLALTLIGEQATACSGIAAGVKLQVNDRRALCSNLCYCRAIESSSHLPSTRLPFLKLSERSVRNKLQRVNGLLPTRPNRLYILRPRGQPEGSCGTRRPVFLQ